MLYHNSFFERWYHKYPGTNFHEQNIDWVIDAIKELAKEMHDFEITNAIKYMGAWNISKQYAIYSVVTDNGLGYLAIDNVPSGVYLTDTRYWVQIADFSAQIADIDSRVTTLESEVVTINGRIDDLEDGTWNKKHILFIGDSYTDGYDPDEVGNLVADPYYKLLCEDYLHPAAYYRASLGGSSFAGGGYTYTDPFNTWIATNPDKLDTIDTVFIIGGYNDVSANPSTIVSNLGTTVSYVRSKLPNVTRFYIAHVGRAPLKQNENNAKIDYINRSSRAYREGATANGCIYIDRSELMLHDYKNFSSDGTHPSQAGHTDLAKYLGEYLLTGSWNYEYQAWRDVTFDNVTTPSVSNTITLPAASLYEKITDSGVMLQMRQKYLTSISPANVVCDGALNHAISLGYIASSTARNYFSSIGAVSYDQMQIDCYGRTTADQTTPIKFTGIITLTDDGEMLLRLISIKDSDWDFVTMTDFLNLIITDITVTLPLEIC